MKKLTPEQKERSAQRREAMREIVSKVAAMDDDERAALTAQCWPTTVEGHKVSPRNACLLALQMRDATIIGGFRQWIRAGRIVRKGERGAMIMFPRGSKKNDGNEESEAVSFGFVTVFDISQTDEMAAERAA